MADPAERNRALDDALLDRMKRALRAVLERHRPEPFEDEPTVAFCVECQRSQMNGVYPCPTVTTIREALA